MPKRFVDGAFLLIFIFCLALLAVDSKGQIPSTSLPQKNAQDENWRNPPPAQKPLIAEANDEGQQAIPSFRVPENWKVQLFAAEPDVANPVAFDVDYQGRVYVIESFRQERGIEDNRSHPEWLVDDLAAMSIQDRLAYIKKHLKTNVNKYTEQDDRIRLLLDSNHDGQADTSKIFSNGYNTILSGSGAGVLSYRNKVYFTCIPDLWMLTDSNQDGVADNREILSTGYGIRFAFRGHDMHGLIVGPDGRLYFSIGDRGYRVPGQKPDSIIADPSSGAVFRCELDGSNLEVIATGLRNPQELAFDDFGNLFTGDNNSDSGDKARWVYVVPGSDSGWRMYYQYLPDRGPFNREKIWHPFHSETPAYIVPPVANLADGPSGLAYYPGTGLSDHFKDRFFLCDFRGQTNISGIRTFRVKPKGAFFEVVDEEQSIWQILPTDIHFGPDGRIYISDWVHGWQGEGKGRIYTFSDPAADAQIIDEVQNLLAEGFKKKTLGVLRTLMSHPDRRVRQETQFELVARNNDEIFFRLAAEENANLFSRLHSIWGIEQILRTKKSGSEDDVNFRKKINELVDQIAFSKEPEVRAQTLRMIGENSIEVNKKVIEAAFRDENRRVVYFAILASTVVPSGAYTDAICQILVDNDNVDPLIRHAAIMAFFNENTGGSIYPESASNRMPRLSIDSAAKHTSSVVRQMAVVALRKRAVANGNPVVKDYSRSHLLPEHENLLKILLDDADQQVATEAARAIYDTQYLGLLEELANQINKPNLTDAFLRRCVAANYRLGQQKNAVLLAELAVNPEASIDRRIDAVRLLGKWASPPLVDGCIGIYWPINDESPATIRNAEFAAEALNSHIDELMNSKPRLVEAFIESAQNLNMIDVKPALERAFGNRDLNPALRAAALRGLARLQHENLNEALESAGESSVWQLRSTALEIMHEQQKPKTFEQFEKAINSTVAFERQKAWRIAGKFKDENSANRIVGALRKITQNQFDPETSLDVFEAAQLRPESAVKEQLEKLELQLLAESQTEKSSAYRLMKMGGHVEQGRKVFFEKTEVSCLRCHKIGDAGGEVGPNLSKIGLEKDIDYLLASIVDPNKHIAENFESVVILDAEGESHTGIIKKRTDDYIELMDADGKVKKILVDDIDETRKGISSMPEDAVAKLTRDELRDVVAFLASLKNKDARQTDSPPKNENAGRGK